MNQKSLFPLLLLIAVFTAGTANAVERLDEALLADWPWRLLGPTMPAGRAWTVVGVERDPKTLYVTTASGGLWKSVNSGTTFEPVFDDAGIHRIVWDLKTDETAEQTRPRRAPVTMSEWEFAQKVSSGRYGVTLRAGNLVELGFVTVRDAPPKTSVR